MINVYMDKLMYSPFDFPSFRKKAANQEKIIILKNPIKANIIMSSYLTVIEKYVNKYGRRKKYILWTHEPYHDFTLNRIKKIKGVVVHIMNVYTNDVFTHNFRYFYFKTPIKQLVINEDDVNKPVIRNNIGSPIVALSTYYPKSYYEKNSHTLLQIRYSLIEVGYDQGLVDVYGKGWDKNKIVKNLGNSRNDSDRRESKQQILGNYKFNICVENTNFPYYVTEKIWEPIKYGCLPIYYPNTTIYEIFPKDSFIDVTDYESVDKLYDRLLHMSEKEYKERYNLCVDAFNQVIENGKNITWRGKSKNQNINYLEYKTCYDQLVKKIRSV